MLVARSTYGRGIVYKGAPVALCVLNWYLISFSCTKHPAIVALFSMSR